MPTSCHMLNLLDVFQKIQEPHRHTSQLGVVLYRQAKELGRDASQYEECSLVPAVWPRVWRVWWMIWQEEEKKVSEYAKWMEKGEVSEYTKWMEKGTDVCMKCSSITWRCLAKLVWLDLLSCVPLLWQAEQPRMMREPRTRWAHMAYVLRFARKSQALGPHCQVCSGTVCVTRKVAPRKVVKEIKVRSSWAAKSSKTGLPNGSKSRWMDAFS